MQIYFYTVLDLFFFVFHSTLILFNLTAWIWKRTRLVHLIVMLSVAASWFIAGLWYGIGYCPFTDWHWQTRQVLGHTDMPYSYVKFLLDTLTGLNFDARIVDYMTGILFGITMVLSLFLNFRDRFMLRARG